MQTQIKPPSQFTDYFIGSNLLANLHKINLFKARNYSSFLILSDTTIFKLYGDKIITSLKKLEKPVIVSQILSSESNKDIGKVTDIVQPYFRNGFNRHACLISIGGGVVTDLGGFIASILLRGIDSIYIPTTLLAQVDAAIGGKTGVNFRDRSITYKNMLGTFNQPKMVISDVKTLFTLPEKEIRNGLGEMVKYWIGWGRPTPEQMKEIKTPRGSPRLAGTPPMVKELIKILSICQQIKLDIVQQDPFETKGIRQKLNLGHTIGHAIEGAGNGRLSHGQAVAIGLAAVSKLSVLKGLLMKNKCEQIILKLKQLGLPTTIKGINKQKVLQALNLDKKGGSFVLIKDIGELITNQKADKKIIDKVLEEVIL